MADSQTWTEHFGITDQHLQQWRLASETTGGATPFLTWCLQNGTIAETDYMRWASSHYRLPIVKDSFFDLPTAETNWATGKFLYRWTEDIIPLEEWEGVVLVACVEPPEKFQIDRPYSFVLASPRQLRVLWHRFFPEAQAEPQAAAVAPLSASADALSDFGGSFDPTSLLAAYNEHADAIEADSQTDPGEPGDPEEPFTMPEGFATISADIHIPMPTFGVKAPVTEAPAIEIPKPTAAVHADADAVAGDVAVAVAEEVHVSPPPISSTGDATPVLPGAPAEFDLCDTIEEVVACAFTKMSKYFPYQLALLPTDEILTPWLWSGKFVRETPNERPAPIDLTPPSFFRIVRRTSMPYHGHTRPSDVNDRFFKEWTQGAALAHVTIVPIMMDENPAIFLLGGMDNVIEPRAALSDMEQWARSAAMACRRISEKPAGAAA